MCNLFKLFKRDPKPYDTGYLPEKDGHEIFYMQIGNPGGEVVLSFHGGPGACSKARHAAVWDLKKYRIIMFDQRGCGLSKFKDAFYKNTTQETVEDAVRLLEHLKIKDKVVALGGSFGSTCALLFAETYPKRVKKMVLASVWLARRRDWTHLSPVTSLFYPDALDVFKKQSGKKSVTDYYHNLIFSDKKSDQKKALQYYGAFEKQLGEKVASFDEVGEVTEKALRKFRIVMLYEKHAFFLKENQLLRDAHKIKQIPCTIFHNRLDMCCPVEQAFELYKALPKSKLYIIPDGGHGGQMMYDRMLEESKKA